MRPAVAILAALVCYVTSNHEARSQGLDVTPTGWLTQLTAQLAASGELDATLHTAQNLFLKFDTTRKGISHESIAIIKASREAAQRAQSITRFMRHDLDGDGILTREEALLALRNEAEQHAASRTPNADPAEFAKISEAHLETLIKQLPNALSAPVRLEDLLRQATVDQEARKATQAKMLAEQHQRMRASGVQLPLQFPDWLALGAPPPDLDPNRDGVLTLEEFLTVVKASLKIVDENGDGRFSPAEIANFLRSSSLSQQAAHFDRRAEEQARDLQKKRKECGISPLPATGRVLLGGVYAGGATSTVALDGQDDSTYAIHLEIEKGDEPLHVVLTSFHSVVWIVTGATARIATVVTNGGVVGIAADRIQAIRKGHECVPDFYLYDDSNNDEETGSAKQARVATEALIGRKVNAIFGRSTAAAFNLPAGKHLETARIPGERPQRGWKLTPSLGESRRVVEIDPARVVARSPVMRYETLPGHSGLQDLVDTGALTVVGWSTGIDLEKMERVSYPSKFRINRKIRIPADLAGSASVHFVLGRDVPTPDGNPGHSCIEEAGTGKTIVGNCP